MARLVLDYICFHKREIIGANTREQLMKLHRSIFLDDDILLWCLLVRPCSFRLYSCLNFETGGQDMKGSHLLTMIVQPLT